MCHLHPEIRASKASTKSGQLHRLFDVTFSGAIKVTDGRDAKWVRRTLADKAGALDRREMMLWSEMHLLNTNVTDRRALFEELRQIVADAPPLAAIIDNALKPIRSVKKCRDLRKNTRNMSERQRRRKPTHAKAGWIFGVRLYGILQEFSRALAQTTRHGIYGP
jgi:hypothetical protein